MSLRMFALVVLLGAGCVNGDVDPPQVGSVQQAVLTCDEFMCGTNSPQIAELGFWELNLPSEHGPGLANNVGLRLVGFVQGGKLYLPAVSGGKLTATRTSNVPPYTITLSGNALIGGYFYLTDDTRAFAINVSEVGTVDSWAQPAGGGPTITLESYKLDWTELVNNTPGRFQNVCKNPPIREPSDLLSMVGAYSFHTLLFEGDRIDAAHKLDTGIDTSWFNLGCAGSALAKMALTGHTEAAASAGKLVTTLGERQAMLKMLTADYCGDGTPFTVAGQPLNWADDHGTMKLAALLVQPPQPLVLEARWTEHGAACLEQPRVDVHPTTLSMQELGSDIYKQVKDHCPEKLPPPCLDRSFGVAGYHLVTATVPL